MAHAFDLPEAISQRLEGYFSARALEAAAEGPHAAHLIAAAARACAGGKRLRAAFCIAGWRAVAGADAAPSAAAVSVAASLEVFQAAALVHDDIVDHSDTRRGRPSAHRAEEAHHRERGWHGDPVDHGTGAALLLGDLLVAFSDDLFEEGLLEAQREGEGGGAAASARLEYARMRRDVTLGQYLDVAEESAFVDQPADEQLARALQIASLKSARYSVEQPLAVGAALAGGDGAQLGALRAFGHPVGMAFQLRDDVLGVFGEAEITGKPAGDDLREGKRTALVALTRRALAGEALDTFDALLGTPLDDDAVASLRDTIEESGALGEIEALIDRYHDEAEAALSGAPLHTEALAELRALAARAVRRNA